MQREKRIVRASLIGIGANLALAGFKAAVGVVSGSIAIVLDAVNNLTDALSSLITLIGAKLAERRPDRAHPFGHGRIEYISALIISAIVLCAGLAALKESVKRIIHPVIPEYTAPGLAIIAAAVAIKLLMGRYALGVGHMVDSDALRDSGTEALFDAAISAATLLAAGIHLLWDLNIEAWLAAAIALIIIKSGARMLLESLSVMLGECPDRALTRDICQTIARFPEVYGARDLLLHSYGPNTTIGSVCIEVDDAMTAGELDALARDIARAVLSEHNVILAGIGVCARSTGGLKEIMADVDRSD